MFSVYTHNLHTIFYIIKQNILFNAFKKKTMNEITLNRNSIIVVRTDLMRKIIYVNDEFLKINGYSRDEIIGKYHKVIYHADMPDDIPDDCFQSLNSLYPWNGVLKNKTKLGDFYWTQTNAVVEFTKGVASQFVFVSFALKKGELEQAESLYSALKNKLTSLKQPTKNIEIISRNTTLVLFLAGFLIPHILVSYELLLSHNYLFLGGLCVSTIIGLISITTVNRLNNILDQSTALFYRLASKKFGNKFDLKKYGLTGDFYRGLFSMDVCLSLDIAESNHKNDENLRMRNALNAVHSSVIVADIDYKIVFYNLSAARLFHLCETEIKKQLPNFDKNKIVGSNMDDFHSTPKKQRDLLSKLNNDEYQVAELTLGNHTLSVSATSVFDQQGEKIGYISEWIDKTAEVRTIKEIAKVVEAASQGNFDERISEKGQQGFFLELSSNLNQLLQNVSDNLHELEVILNELAEGNLAHTMTKEYQGIFGRVKDSVNTATVSLRNIILKIKETTSMVSLATKDIALSNNELSHRTEGQAASLEETAASIHELITTVQYNNDNVQQATLLAVKATETANKGIAVIGQAVGTMKEINESSLRIIDIISVIDDISFQTNILALNAAVEAARAGELGQGFAVVATEVRNLAQRSANAAGEIKLLIDSSVERISFGDKQVSTAGLTMQEIVASIENVTSIITEIASASSQQSAGISQIGQAISSMDDTTQRNASMAVKMATAAEALEMQTNYLAKEMSYFKTNNENYKKSKNLTSNSF